MPMQWAAVAAAGLSLALAGAAPAEAHHSIQSVVDTSKIVQGEMVLTKVDWINPHSWFHFTAKDGTAVGTDVLIEWLSLTGLRQAGYGSAAVFVLGHTYAVNYNPNRDNSPGGNLVSMTDETTGRVYDREGSTPVPPPVPPIPQARPNGPGKTNVNF